MTTQITLAKKKRAAKVTAADLWCGGGGSTTGLHEALDELGLEADMIALNHWQVAVSTHEKNYPKVKHFCKAVDSVSPLDAVPGGYLKIFLASPECIGHSRARGGRPTTDQKRADAMDILRWTEKLFIENLIIENVPEFLDWGPLGRDGKPLKSRKGEFFKRFIDFLRVSYAVEWRILNCADYGDYTSRRRLFILAKRGRNKKIVFPAPTHASRAVLAKQQPDLFSETPLKPWKSAKEIINWNLKGRNIFGRKKPLASNTVKRIFAGLRKFSGIDIPEREIIEAKPLFEAVFKDDAGNITELFHFPSSEWIEKRRAVLQRKADEAYQTAPIKLDLTKINPFTLGVGGATGQQNPRSIDEPMRTLTGTPMFAVAKPYMLNMKGSQRMVRSIDEPSFSQTANSQHQYLVQPYMVNLSHTKNNDASMCRSLDESFPVICGKAMLAKVSPSLIKFYGGQHSANLDEPLPTITAQYEHFAVAEPVITKFHGSHKGKTDGAKRVASINEPLGTIDASNRFGLGSAFLLPTNHGKNDMRTHSLDEPLPTITSTFDALAHAEAFLVKYNNNEDAKDINEPLPTVTTKDRCGLSRPLIKEIKGGTFDNDGEDAETSEEQTWKITPQIVDGIVEPFLVKLESEKEEIFGLLLHELGAVLIIDFRMLEDKELSKAMSFPDGYYFHGNRSQRVRQIGNAVPVKTMKALCLAQLSN